MKKTRRLWILTVLTLLAAVLALAFASCAGGVKLVKFELPESPTAEIGSEYTLPAADVADSEGTRLFPDVEVKDAEGNEVEVNNNKFYVSKLSGYSARYTVTYGKGLTESRELKIKVADTGKPVIDLGGKTRIFAVKGREVTLPAAKVTDASGEKIAAEITVKIGESTIKPENGKIVFDTSGEYTAVYTATDSSGNVGSYPLTVSCAYEENTVAYFGHAGGEAMAAAHESVTLVSSDEVTYGEEKASLNVRSASETGFTDLLLDAPALSDISSYDAMYLYIYNASAFEIEVTTNQVYNPSRIAEKSWGLLQIYKGEKGWIKDSYSDAEEKRAFAVGDMAAKNPATPENIDGFKISFKGRENGALNVYLSGVKVSANGRAPAAENPVLPFMELGKAGEIPLPKLVSFAGGEPEVTKAEVVHPDGTAADLEKEKEKYTFTPTAEGKYTIRYTFRDKANGLTNFSSTQFIAADLSGLQNQIIPLTESYALDMLKANGETSLKIVDCTTFPTGGTRKVLEVKSFGYEFTDIKFVAPAITDVRGAYSIAYYIYNPTDDVLKALVNNNGGNTVARLLKPRRWMLVEYKAEIFDSVFPESDGKTYPNSPENIANYTIHLLNENEVKNTEVYITTPMIRTEDESVEATVPHLKAAFAGDEIEVPAAVAGAGVGVDCRVYAPDYTLLAANESRFVAEKTGVYEIEYVLTDETGRVSILTRYISVISKEGYAAGDMFLFDNENGALLHGTEGGGFEPEVKHGGEKGSVKVTGNTEWLNLIAHDSLEKDISAYGSFYVWIYNAQAKDGTAFFNNDVPRFTLKAQAWTQVEVVNDNGVWKYNGTPIKFYGSAQNIEKFMISFDNPSLETLTYYVGKITARAGRNPVAHNGLNAFYTVGDVVDIGLVTATDYWGNPVAATVGVTAPDGGAVTIGEDGRFSAAMEGEYVVTVRYEEKNLFLEAVYRFVVQSGKINRKVFAPAENMPLEGNFLDYGEERLRFLSGEGMTYGDDGYALVVNAKEDGCWIDFSILTEKIDLSKIDRITFAIKCFAANATGSQVFLKSNGADRLLARSGNSGAVPMRADVGNIVAGRWCEISIFKDRFTEFFGGAAEVSQFHFLINPATADGYQSMYYEYAISSICVKTESAVLKADENLVLTEVIENGENKVFALESNADYVYGNDARSIKIYATGGAWIDFKINFSEIDLTKTEKIYFYVMRTAPDANGAVTVQGEGGAQITLTTQADMDVNQWTRIEIPASRFAEVFGSAEKASKLKIIINNTAADDNAYDYQFFMSSIFAE